MQKSIYSKHAQLQWSCLHLMLFTWPCGHPAVSYAYRCQWQEGHPGKSCTSHMCKTERSSVNATDRVRVVCMSDGTSESCGVRNAVSSTSTSVCSGWSEISTAQDQFSANTRRTSDRLNFSFFVCRMLILRLQLIIIMTYNLSRNCSCSLVRAAPR